MEIFIFKEHISGKFQNLL